MDPAGSGYVVLIGRAEIVTDPEARASHFKERWSSFYPGGAGGDDFVAIRVVPLRIEVVSYADGIMGDPVTWRPPSVEFR